MWDIEHHTGTLKLVKQKEGRTPEDWCTEKCLNDLQTHEFLSKRQLFDSFGNKFILMFGKVYYINNHKSTSHNNAIMVEDMVLVEKSENGDFDFSVLLRNDGLTLSQVIVKEFKCKKYEQNREPV